MHSDGLITGGAAHPKPTSGTLFLLMEGLKLLENLRGVLKVSCPLESMGWHVQMKSAIMGNQTAIGQYPLPK